MRQPCESSWERGASGTSGVTGRTILCLVLGVCASSSSFAARQSSSPTAFRVVSRYWVPPEAGDAALASTAQRLRVSVASAMSEGLLEDGFPRDCAVTEPEVRSAPFYPECVEGAAMPDGLLLDADGGFVQFVPVDFRSARAFLFEVYLISDAATAQSLTPEELSAYPYVAIPMFELSESTFRERLGAIMRGIVSAGAEPLQPR